MKRIDELESNLASATPGEWDFVCAEGGSEPEVIITNEGYTTFSAPYFRGANSENDAALIAEALNTLPDLIEAAKALEALAQYVGGWDEPVTHPCGRAAAILNKLGLGG